MGIGHTLKEIWAYRQMIVGLVRRDLRGRYKGSVLGFLWTFINPLLQLLVYTLVFGVLFKSSTESFYLFLFVALIPWLFFSTSITSGCNAVLDQKGLVTKVTFPREILPIAHVTSAFINMLYCLIIVVAVALFASFVHFNSDGVLATFPPLNQQGVSFNLAPLVLFPLVLVIEYILCLGIVFFLSGITVYFRDLSHIMGIASMLWFYLTPVVYNLEEVIVGHEKYKWLFFMNPMTDIVYIYRNIFYYGSWPTSETWFYLMVPALWAIVFLLVGFLTFQKAKKRFAEEL